ncbi:MAG: VWA domain-containing protein [Planctomycetes bacterium]|nr:VWA domain-containing protein [Planctomycetota bacterium]
MTLSFQNPQAFYLLWLLLPLWLLLWGGYLLRRRDLVRFYRDRMPFGAEIAGGSGPRQWVVPLTLSLVLVFTVLSMARPAWGYRTERNERLATDVIICLDTSRSMLAEDAPGGRPRLDFARLKIGMMLDALPGERVALVAFAGEGIMACPLTYDNSAPRDMLAALSADIVPLGGTSMASAIDRAMTMFRTVAGGERVIVLVSDGEEHNPETLDASLKNAAAAGVAVFVLGVGSAEGAPIKIRRNDGSWEYVKDSSGAVVESRLNEELLLNLARNTGGAYARAVAGNEDIRTVAAGISALNPGSAGEVITRVPVERHLYPAVVAMLLLWFILLLPAPRPVGEGTS